MKTIRILFAGLPTLMTDILQHLAASDPAVTVVGRAGASDLLAEARRWRADVIVVARKAKDERRKLAKLLLNRPRLKVLAIAENGAAGTLYEMRPRRIFIGNISAHSLSQAIHGRPPASAARKRKLAGAR